MCMTTKQGIQPCQRWGSFRCGAILVGNTLNEQLLPSPLPHRLLLRIAKNPDIMRRSLGSWGNPEQLFLWGIRIAPCKLRKNKGLTFTRMHLPWRSQQLIGANCMWYFHLHSNVFKPNKIRKNRFSSRLSQLGALSSMRNCQQIDSSRIGRD